MTAAEPGVTAAERETVERQLGRPPRGVVAVAHRCACGRPDVVTTAPTLPDGLPFPTLYYLTCPRASAAVGRLEAGGEMRGMEQRLANEPALAAAYRGAHEDYLRRREALGTVDAIAGISAGGMPDRVKCLHALAAHALAVGPGVNPLGDEVVAAISPWWQPPCLSEEGETSRERATHA
jgi:hypothetical protein